MEKELNLERFANYELCYLIRWCDEEIAKEAWNILLKKGITRENLFYLIHNATLFSKEAEKILSEKFAKQQNSNETIRIK